MSAVLGWRYWEEDFAWLGRHQTLGSSWRPLLRGRFAPPAEIDPRGWHVIENQAQMGSCQGHALSSALEYAFRVATGGEEDVQLSRMYAYIMSQNVDGISGDRGSTISGGAKVATDNGLCREATWPYTGRYTRSIPQKAHKEAPNYKLRTMARMRSYNDCYTFLASGAGGIDIGITWNGGMDKAVVESYRGGGGGGHALAMLGYSGRVDGEDRNYIWVANSWGTGWGNDGWTEWSPRAVDQMFNAQFTLAYGLSDMDSVKPRKIRWIGEGSVF